MRYCSDPVGVGLADPGGASCSSTPASPAVGGLAEYDPAAPSRHDASRWPLVLLLAAVPLAVALAAFARQHTAQQ